MIDKPILIIVLHQNSFLFNFVKTVLSGHVSNGSIFVKMSLCISCGSARYYVSTLYLDIANPLCQIISQYLTIFLDSEDEAPTTKRQKL